MPEVTDELEQRLKKESQEILDLLDKNLVNRSQWGSDLTFKDAEKSYEKITISVKPILDFPIEYFPSQVLHEIVNNISKVLRILKDIDNFSIDIEGNLFDHRNNLIMNLNNHVDHIYSKIGPWITFLISRSGDIIENEKALNTAKKDFENLQQEIKSKFEKDSKEMSGLLEGYREASAAGGAGVFNKEFEKISKEREEQSENWLWAAGILAALTLVSIISFLFKEYQSTNYFQIAHFMTSKIVIVSLLTSATVWCAKNYRILKHLAATNKHRAISLQTLKAFVNAASDDMTKNAVLTEATRAVFNIEQTGYIGSGSGGKNNSATFIDMATHAASSIPKS